MARANRHYIPGCIWHITHRCHKKEFLLKFHRDKRKWLSLLYEAKKRFTLKVLNYSITSNHIHLLVYDNGKSRDTIPNSIQLMAGRTGQDFNLRKKRKGAFWEDRYHATAIDKNEYLAKCMLYIDMNMVRAGVVDHPSEWPFCGFCEIQSPKERYRFIDRYYVCDLMGFDTYENFKKQYLVWIKESVESKVNTRNQQWTKSIAVGDRGFIEDVKHKLGVKGIGRKIREDDGTFELKEEAAPYGTDFYNEIETLSPKNTYYW